MYREKSNLNEDKKNLLLKEVSRRLPYHTSAIYKYNNSIYLGKIIDINIDEEVITLQRKIKDGNIYEKVFIENLKLVLKPIDVLPEVITFFDINKYDEEHIDFCNLIGLGLAVENEDLL